MYVGRAWQPVGNLIDARAETCILAKGTVIVDFLWYCDVLRMQVYTDGIHHMSHSMAHLFTFGLRLSVILVAVHSLSKGGLAF